MNSSKNKLNSEIIFIFHWYPNGGFVFIFQFIFDFMLFCFGVMKIFYIKNILLKIFLFYNVWWCTRNFSSSSVSTLKKKKKFNKKQLQLKILTNLN